MIEQLHGALDQALSDARAICIIGRDGKLCAGFDLSVMTSGIDATRALVKEGGELLMRLYGHPQPTVVAVTGHALAAGALLVENLERGIGSERVLFHLLNAARERQLSLLLTTRTPVAAMIITLPDLSSRLRAVPVATISPPDTTLLRAVLVKHFSDRQLSVEPAVIETIVRRMERSMEMAHAVVAAIDERALAMKRKVTRPLVLEALAALGAPADDELDSPAMDH